MDQFISFFATRVSSAPLSQRLPARKYVEAVRSSLVNAGGLVYPNLQSSGMWTDFAADDKALVFTFDRRSPVGDLRVENDGSYNSTRSLLDDEAGPILFLEALTWELVGNLMFFHNFIKAIKRPGVFHTGISLGGFNNALVDWAGLEETARAKSTGMLVNWRFGASGEVASFESDDIQFPVTEQTEHLLFKGMFDIIGELSFAVQGIRRSPYIRVGNTIQSRLTLSEASIRNVIAHARGVIVGSTRGAGIGIRDEILSMIQDYIREHEGQEPRMIHLTRDDERRLAAMTRDEAGGGVSSNVREQFGIIDGKKVMWDSENRYCE